MNEKFKGIKTDKIEAIFEAALDNKYTTRNDISAHTGFSFVTVNNVVTALVEENVLRQSKGKDHSGSRRSRILAVKHKYWIGIYNLSADRFSFTILDLSFKSISNFDFTPSNDVNLERCVKQFLRESACFAKNTVDYSSCCGIGILVPGEYDDSSDSVDSNEIPHLKSLRIKELFSKFSFGHEPIVMSVYLAFAKTVQSQLSDNEHVYSLFLNKHSVTSAHISRGNDNSIFISDLGNLYLSDGSKISANLKNLPDPDPFFNSLANIIFTVLHAVPVSRITVSGNMYSRLDAVGIVLKRELLKISEKSLYIPPEIYTENLLLSAFKGISYKIRQKWMLDHLLS